MMRASRTAVLIVAISAGCAPSPPEVHFERVRKEQIVSTLTTNGRMEPARWSAARAERAGVVTSVRVNQGDRVVRGAALAEIRARESEAELQAAEARVAQARSELSRYDRGGDPAQLAEIEGALQKHRQDRAVAVREAAALDRLLAKGAATKQELQAQRDQVAALEVEIMNLERRRATLLTPEGRTAAEARLRDAIASFELARKQSALSTVRSPETGVAFHVAARAGAYVQPGDLIAEVGRVDELRLVIYVDEPELGRVAPGMPVRVTWDAAPGKEWSGRIERMPSQIVAEGSRQVGEVLCTIENPNRELSPGANVNVEVRSRVVEGALAVPKEALRRQDGSTGVFVLEGSRLAWRAVQPGVSSVTRVEVQSGLKEGDLVALPGEAPLSPGREVKAVVR